MAASVQPSFAAGEVSPELHGRVDQALYYIGLARAKNMIVQQAGGIYNRPGLRYIGNTKNHEQGARLIQFKFSAEDTYILELGHMYMRFIRNDAYVTEGGKTITSINRGSSTIVSSNGHGYSTGDDVYISGVGGMKEINERWFRVVRVSANQFRLQSQVDDTNINSGNYSGYSSGGKAYKIYEISTPYEFDDLPELKYSQSADVITLAHLGYPVYELRRMGHVDWSLEKVNLQKESEISVSIPTYFYDDADNYTSAGATKNIDFVVTSIDDEGNESSAGLIPVGYNLLGFVSSGGAVTVTYGNLQEVGKPSHLVGEAFPSDFTHYSELADSSSNYVFPGIINGDQIYISGLPGIAELNNKYFFIESLNTTTKTFVLSGLENLGDSSFSPGGKIFPAFFRRVTKAQHNSNYWRIQIRPQSGVRLYRLYYRYGLDEFRLAAENSAGNTYSLHGIPYVGFFCHQRGNNLSGSSIATTIVALDNVADNDLRPPLIDYSLFFSKEGEYPSVTGFYQQRRIFGATKNNPDRMYYSKVGDYLFFKKDTILQNDDDPIVTTLSSGEVNNIRHLVGLNNLLIFTDSAQWQVRPAVGSGLSAKTIEQRPQARVGSSHITPVIFDDVVVYVREGGQSIIGLGYNVDREGYVPSDLSLLSNHMFEATPVVVMAGMYVPRKQLFCVLADGNVACLTFIPDQKVIAWTRWYTDGEFESIAVARPSIGSVSDDEAYFVVRRVINGQVVRYVERTDSRQFEDVEDCYFVDAGLTYDNPIEITDIDRGGTTTVTAEDHGLAVGYEINFSDIKWEKKYDEFFTEVPLDQLNKHKYKVKSVLSTSKFTLGNFDDNSDIDSTEFTRYIDAGKVRSMVQTLRGLWYLEGKRVVVLADGNVLPSQVVQDGKIVLPHRYGRIQIGLRYISEIETLPIGIEEPSLQGAPKTLTEVLIRVYRSRGLLLASIGGDFYELPMRTDEAWSEPTKLLTSNVTIPMSNQWGTDGSFIVRQKDPLPMGILSVSPSFTLGDAK